MVTRPAIADKEAGQSRQSSHKNAPTKTNLTLKIPYKDDLHYSNLVNNKKNNAHNQKSKSEDIKDILYNYVWRSNIIN